MTASSHFADNIYQTTEIEQASDIRQATFQGVCHMVSATSLLNATCSLLNQKGAF